ncbi:hypothetical protein [Nitratireductor sp. XY-223]|uniref:hypothetical protein n=1 Tax=Nitratireductor sp. XY-223 TaxID=2561926 RepID=UPI0010AA15E7|nr:hypothetical protein [Nitratireductor sp. XY-223]
MPALSYGGRRTGHNPNGLVKACLKSPCTGRFGHISLETAGDCVWSTRAHVDAQNGFGAMRRTRFNATIKFDVGRQKWELVSFRWS